MDAPSRQAEVTEELLVFDTHDEVQFALSHILQGHSAIFGRKAVELRWRNSSNNFTLLRLEVQVFKALHSAFGNTHHISSGLLSEKSFGLKCRILDAEAVEDHLLNLKRFIEIHF